jgi:hypothetical protein
MIGLEKHKNLDIFSSSRSLMEIMLIFLRVLIICLLDSIICVLVFYLLDIFFISLDFRRTRFLLIYANNGTDYAKNVISIFLKACAIKSK